VSEEIVGLFEDELSFKEGEVTYWLPIQSQVIPYFKEELKVGDKVELYLIWIGARRESEVTDWVFLVNEFQKDNALSSPPPNKRLERTRHERASLLGCVGEPLKRSVGCFEVPE
jgi:hypothetical protein